MDKHGNKVSVKAFHRILFLAMSCHSCLPRREQLSCKYLWILVLLERSRTTSRNKNYNLTLREADTLEQLNKTKTKLRGLSPREISIFLELIPLSGDEDWL
jgi:hypothetical protein